MTVELHHDVAKGPNRTVVQKKCFGLELHDHVQMPVSLMYIFIMWSVFGDPVTNNFYSWKIFSKNCLLALSVVSYKTAPIIYTCSAAKPAVATDWLHR